MVEAVSEMYGGRWGQLAVALRRYAEDGIESDDTGAALAAVLILLYDKDDQPHIVLTRRTNYVQAHKGEISLPGGAFEADKDASLLHTAMREAAEEVGVDGTSLTILGRLPQVHTNSSNYIVVPYVATSGQRPAFRADPFEVAEVLEVPLERLLRPESLQEDDWELEGIVQRVSFYSHGEHKIWGATARILTEFFGVLRSSGT